MLDCGYIRRQGRMVSASAVASPPCSGRGCFPACTDRSRCRYRGNHTPIDHDEARKHIPASDGALRAAMYSVLRSASRRMTLAMLGAARRSWLGTNLEGTTAANQLSDMASRPRRSRSRFSGERASARLSMARTPLRSLIIASKFAHMVSSSMSLADRMRQVNRVLGAVLVQFDPAAHQGSPMSSLGRHWIASGRVAMNSSSWLGVYPAARHPARRVTPANFHRSGARDGSTRSSTGAPRSLRLGMFSYD